jgi:B-box zinc finger/Zinc finger, C3HC4 type (RING finger)
LTDTNAMAESSSLEQLDKLIQCSFCFDVVDDPRTLPCIHTMCMSCAAEVLSGNLPGAKVGCPICAKLFELPKNCLEGLFRNSFIENMKHIQQLSNCLKTPCEACNSSAAQTLFCAECNEKLCATCGSRHTNFKMFRSHNIVKLGQDVLTKESIALLSKQKTCEFHKNKHLELYCIGCQEAICVICYVEFHNTHRCSDLSKAADKFRSELAANVEDLAACESKWSDMLKTLDSAVSDFNEQIERTMSEVVGFAEQMKQKIDLEKDSILNQLTKLQNARVQKVNEITSNVEETMMLVDNLKMYIQQLIDKGLATDVTTQMRLIPERVRELIKLDKLETDMGKLGSIDVVFAPSGQLTSTGTLLGKVETQISAEGRICNR